ncbi:MFS transporter [Maribellus maritimus]|uniref:MFS transporter n=1 Tax=Maribellus maritimus TaxID=2870838 RepID=UPI001EEC4622|nr:MFS transporter [Maribellus maritimus]MCG6188675.1 MFS transporter [Maribellus maritimus]
MQQYFNKKELFKLGAGFILLSAGASWGLSSLLAVLLAAKIGIVAGEASKVDTLAWVATIANICGFAIAIFAGHFSDRTRSRIGKRNPWIVGSGIGTFLSFLLLMWTDDIFLLALSSSLISIFITVNMVVTSAIIPDRVPIEKRGTLASCIGIGQLIGMAIGLALGGNFVDNVNTGLIITGLVPFIVSIVFVLLIREESNINEPLQSDSTIMWQSFFTPKNSRDFYWAILSRFILVFGTQMILAYQLYIITDHFHQQSEGTVRALNLAAIAYTVGALIGGAVGGPLSDKLGKRKGLTILSVFIIGSSILLIIVFPTVTSFAWYKLLNGLGYGVYLSVHTALTADLIPDGNSKAKDMSFLSVANGLGGVFAPLLSAFAIGLGMGYNPMFIIATILSIGSLFLILPIKSVK